MRKDNCNITSDWQDKQATESEQDFLTNYLKN